MHKLLDTHQHILLRDRLGYAWSDGLAPLKGRGFTPSDYNQLVEGRGVAGSILMEADASDFRAEARLMSAIARQPSSGVLGVIASCRPEEDGFQEWRAECAELAVVGFRCILHEVPDSLSQGAVFRNEIARLDVPFDMVFRADQLALALDLARACPNTQLVLDHCGVPDIAGGGLDPWRAYIAALAACDNVVCKMSGVLAYCKPEAADIEAVRPYAEHVIACFGAERLMWGSDWPVVNLTSSLPDWIAVFRELIESLSDDEQAAICHNTAERVYGVTLPG